MSKLKPETYNEFIKGLELKNIYLKRGFVDFKTENSDVVRNPVFDFRTECSYAAVGEETFRVEDELSLAIRQKDQRKTDIMLQCTFVLLYTSKAPMSDEIFKTFSALNVPLNTWPYFREFVQSCTSRLGLPPLVLPLLKGPRRASPKREEGRGT
jgi:preprotein translocase subunit SecB